MRSAVIVCHMEAVCTQKPINIVEIRQHVQIALGLLTCTPIFHFIALQKQSPALLINLKIKIKKRKKKRNIICACMDSLHTSQAGSQSPRSILLCARRHLCLWDASAGFTGCQWEPISWNVTGSQILHPISCSAAARTLGGAEELSCEGVTTTRGRIIRKELFNRCLVVQRRIFET